MARNPIASKFANRIAEHLEQFAALGGFVEGATDRALDRFRVVAPG